MLVREPLRCWGELGDQPLERQPMRPGQRQDAIPPLGRDEGSKRFGHRAERQLVAELDAPPDEYGGTGRLETATCLGEEAGLPDPRLAGDEHEQ